jgi:hypothetical protein
MALRQIDLSQISTAGRSSNNQVITVVSNTVVWANVAIGAAAFGYSIIFGG